MKIYQIFYLGLFCSFLFAFARSENIIPPGHVFNDSSKTITVRGKFIKHIQDPCCCFAWIKEKNIFELSFVSNWQTINRFITVEYDDCEPQSFIIGRYYTIVAKMISGDSFYQNISTSLTTVDSVAKRFIKAELAPGLRIRN